jgi:hypothetical protein
MPLASALTASLQRAEVAKAERQRLERRNRLLTQRRRQSLPCNAFHSNVVTGTAGGDGGTKASFSKIDGFRAIRRERSSSSLAPTDNGSKENKQPAHSKAAAEAVIRRRTSTGTSNAVVRTKTTRLSPILTRSVTKKEREKLVEAVPDADIAVPKVLLFSPPNQATNERREQERIVQKESERYVLPLDFVCRKIIVPNDASHISFLLQPTAH